ncbi:GGDEF domain-containing protein [Halochromatium glycolicum]|uniref:Diguanylate cyclase (GGDEF) domain-containing protein n=1 Tax=Halochromatium glycolicum TaxID=85075 RepID=A0AAJ0UA61_9GAMM|nr:GGDEF domain-containing protein [Halochromatium glycolicum]MBK1706992.1 hypothetical protein [Halochromatium glycolicum]
MRVPTDARPIQRRDGAADAADATTVTATRRYNPLFDSQSGSLYAFEGWSSSDGACNQPQEMIHRSLLDGLMSALDALSTSPKLEAVRLLWPLDLSTMRTPGWPFEQTSERLRSAGIDPARLVFEVAGRGDTAELDQVLAFLAELRRDGHLIAIGAQLSYDLRLRLLHEQAPELARLAPFLVDGVEHDPKKRLLLTHAVRQLQGLGVKVWASGIQNDAALRICQDIGCDLVAGPALASPESEPARIPLRCGRTGEDQKMRRRDDTGPELVRSQLEQPPPLPVDAPMQQVFDWFREHVEHSYFPVLNAYGRPLGLLRERDIKRFTYSSYGRELLSNRALKKSLADFLTPCPTVDISASAELILEVYAASDQPPGVIVTKDWRYHGFLSQAALLQIIEQQKLATAREQNPLTGLPGNRQILAYIGETLEAVDCTRALAYFDFDHFKPFNDRYGFRHGDRVIQLFGELLRKGLPANSTFAGHIGGDDFFAGFHRIDETEVTGLIMQLLRDFECNAESLYEPEDRERGYIEAPARADLSTRRLPLLRCSAALMLIPAGVGKADQVETITRQMAMLKKRAKASPDGLATLSLEMP